MNLTSFSVDQNASSIPGQLPMVAKWTESARTIGIMSTTIICMLGVFENVITIIAIARNAKLHTVPNVLILNLCINDTTFCGIVLPVLTVTHVMRRWVLGNTFCNIFPFLHFTMVGSAMMGLVLISINRYILIVHQHVYLRLYTRRNLILMIIVAWLFPALLLSLPLFKIWGVFGYIPSINNCTILRKQSQGYTKFLMSLAFGIPLTAILYCYLRIYFVVRKSKLKLQKHQAKISSPPSIDSLNLQRRRTQDMKLTKMVVTIVAVFVICYLPFIAMSIIDPTLKRPLLLMISAIFGWSTSWINPIVYVLMNRQLRVAYITVFPCMKTIFRPDSVNGNATFAWDIHRPRKIANKEVWTGSCGAISSRRQNCHINISLEDLEEPRTV